MQKTPLMMSNPFMRDNAVRAMVKLRTYSMIWNRARWLLGSPTFSTLPSRIVQPFATTTWPPTAATSLRSSNSRKICDSATSSMSESASMEIT